MIYQHIPPKDDRPCICKICICGHHPCPGLAKMIPLEGISSYRDHYPGCQLEGRVTPRRHPASFCPSKAGPGHFQTTNQVAYDPIKDCHMDRQQSCRPREATVVNCPFAGDTTYHVDYPRHEIGMGVKCKNPKEALRSGAHVPGAFDTTNQLANNAIMDAYRNGTLQRSEPIKNRDATSVGKGQFDGKSSYQEHYPGCMPEHGSSRRTDRGCINAIPDNRDFLTTNSTAYQPIPEDRNPKCPACFAPRRPPSSDGHIKLTEVPDGYGNMTPIRA
eukprot:Tbor_TRINITY_DN5327_c7_g3::TRINITY_DN5327_c7_g3_i1::g.4968::m.4968